MNKQGFTLAEILIALAIIGIVAALTVPALSDAYRKRILTTQLQKAYAELSQAGTTVMAMEMVDNFTKSNAIKDLEFMDNYLILAKKGNEFADSYGYVNNENANYDIMEDFLHIWPYPDDWDSETLTEDDYKCGVTKSGAAVCISKYATGILDVNGRKGPNLFGRDAFQIGFKADGTVSSNYCIFLDNIIWNDWNIDKPNEKIRHDRNDDNN